MKITGIETELGNKILEELFRSDWKKIKEYNILAFDKGIDFDSYTLKKRAARLQFEWTNWFEWEITGSKQVLEELIEKYDL